MTGALRKLAPQRIQQDLLNPTVTDTQIISELFLKGYRDLPQHRIQTLIEFC